MLKILTLIGMLGLFWLACGGCAVLAVRTGARAVKNIRENETAGQTTENQERPRLIHRPGLLPPATNAAPTNRPAGDGAN
jgi:hypothetical protein